MVAKKPDSVTLFFRNPDNFQYLSMSQLLKLAELQQEIDELNSENLSDFDLTARDVKVGHLRDGMIAIVDKAMASEPSVDVSTDELNEPLLAPRHMAGKERGHSG
jgi:hypothetical protein